MGDRWKDFPEHAKLMAVAEQSQAIGAFLDDSGYVLYEPVEDKDGDIHHRPTSKSITDVLADYFGIDIFRGCCDK